MTTNDTAASVCPTCLAPFLTMQEAVQRVREHSGGASFVDGDGIRWRIEAIPVQLTQPPAKVGAYESFSRMEGVARLAFYRLTPNKREVAAEDVATAIIRRITFALRAPAHARERLTDGDRDAVAQVLLRFAEQWS